MLIWGFYTIAKILPITNQIELINKKNFAKATFNKNVKIFIIYVILLITMLIHITKKT